MFGEELHVILELSVSGESHCFTWSKYGLHTLSKLHDKTMYPYTYQARVRASPNPPGRKLSLLKELQSFLCTASRTSLILLLSSSKTSSLSRSSYSLTMLSLAEFEEWMLQIIVKKVSVRRAASETLINYIQYVVDVYTYTTVYDVIFQNAYRLPELLAGAGPASYHCPWLRTQV